MKDLTWHSLSFFCDTENWNILLDRGIKQFIALQKKHITYQIYLSYLSSPNIRFSLLTSEEQKDSLANLINQHFNNFFLTLPKKNIELPDDSIAMPFPSNTIQYGLYELLYDDRLLKTMYEFQKELSDIMIDALSEESIDDETILTFAFYLHAELIKVFTNYYPGEANDLLDAYQIDFIYRQPDIKSLHNYYTDNKDLLLSITKDIYLKETDSENEIPGWLKKWSNICRNFTKSVISTEYQSEKTLKEKIKSIQKELIILINKHLAVTGFYETLLFYLIYQTQCVYFEKNVVNSSGTFKETLNKMKKDHLTRLGKPMLLV